MGASLLDALFPKAGPAGNSRGKGVETMKKQNWWLFTVLCGTLMGSYVLWSAEHLYAAPAQAKETVQALVSINKADASGLESIKGIGPMLAQRILAYRQSNGPFKQLEDLTQVAGIGQAKFEKIKSQITL